MSKIERALKYQEQQEGLTDDLKLVKEIYDAVLRTSRSEIAFSQLTKSVFIGKYPNSRRYIYLSDLAKEILKIKESHE